MHWLIEFLGEMGLRTSIRWSLQSKDARNDSFDEEKER